MSLSTSVKVSGLVSSLIFFAIYLPLSLLFLYKLLCVRHDPAFTARHSYISLITIGAIILQIILSGFYCLEMTNYISFHLEYLEFLSYFVLSYSICARFWLYYYRIEMEHLTEGQEWKSIIDGQMQDEMKNDWFLVHVSTYGKWNWLRRPFWCIIFIGGVLCPLIASFVKPNMGSFAAFIFYATYVITLVLVITPVVILVYLIYDMQEFQDRLFVLDEFAKLKTVGIAAVCAATGLVVFISIFGSGALDGDESEIVLILILEHLVAFIELLLVYIMSYWVVKKLDENGIVKVVSMLPKHRSRGSVSMSDLTHTHTTTFQTNSSMETSRDSNVNENSRKSSNSKKAFDVGKISKLEFILKHDESLNLYMSHLQKEFQEEVLLSFIELLQFRKYVESNLSGGILDAIDENGNGNNDRKNEEKLNLKNGDDVITKTNTSLYGYGDITFASACPYSSIIQNEIPFEILDKYNGSDVSGDVLALQYKAHLLFIKYIKSGSAEFEINISYYLRKRYARNFGDLDRLVANEKFSNVSDFVTIWDACLEEQWKYCTNSVTRFKHTSDFKKLKAYFQEQ